MNLSAQDMVAAADKQVETINLENAKTVLGSDSCIFVDIRDIRELQREGKIPGAIHAPRGMLEFWVDPTSPYHREVFAEDKQFIFYCAAAWRSALATLTVQTMGMKNVCHLAGGFAAWREADYPIEALKSRD